MRARDDETLLCCGPAAEHLREPLAALTGMRTAAVTRRCFPDQETCIRIEGELGGRDVVIVQGTHPPQDRHLQQLYQMLEIASMAGARRIVAIVPYLAYARQDRRSAPGEAFSGMLQPRVAAMLGAETLVAVDVHNPAMLASAPLRGVSLRADREIARWLGARAPSNAILVSPDRGGAERVERIAGLLRWPSLVCRKSKDERGSTWYEGARPEGVEGRVAVILDDLCSSGSTLAPLLEHLASAGAKDCVYCVTHLLTDAARLQALVGRPIEVVSTDTVPNPSAALSVAPLLAGWLEEEGLARPRDGGKRQAAAS